MSARRTLALAATLVASALCAAAPTPASAGNGTANCTGFIDAFPATISTQGVWCLSKDLSESDPVFDEGRAIEVLANNVTIDCNGHALVHLVGLSTQRIAIQANNRTNLTVRGCEFRGFLYGVVTIGGGGHLIEDNRFQGITLTAIYLSESSNNLVRRNRIYDTGGSTVASVMGVIRAEADIIDNVIDGVLNVSAGTALVGISVEAPDVEVSRNVVRGFQAGGSGSAVGIAANQARVVVAENVVITSSAKIGAAIAGSTTGICTGNRVVGFNNKISNCGQVADNITP